MAKRGPCFYTIVDESGRWVSNHYSFKAARSSVQKAAKKTRVVTLIRQCTTSVFTHSLDCINGVCGKGMRRIRGK